MKQKDEMLEEYDFTNGVRRKYAQAYKEGVNIVKLDTASKKFFSISLTKYQFSAIINY